jgi:ribokinase
MIGDTAPSVVVFGSLHLDVIVQAPARPRLGETVVGSFWALKPGGKGGNQAVEAARHGARTAMVGAVGGDTFGAALLANLCEHGVHAGQVAVRAEPSGMSVAISEPSGDYGAIIVSGVNLTLGQADVAAASGLFGAARWLVLQNEAPEAANIAAAAAARASGCRVLLNAAPARDLPEAFTGLLDILVVNALEAEALAGVAVADADDAARAASALLRLAPCAIVTAGGAGLAVADRSGWKSTLPAHRVAVVSTHGAGDAFVGALAARLADGAAMADAVRYANAAAALLVATPADARERLGPAAVAAQLRQAAAPP